MSELEALTTLIQIYLSHTFKWYSSLIASAVGVIAVPIIALNITITNNNPNTFAFAERSFFSFLTLILLLASLYLVSKVNYSLGLLQEIYERIEVKDTGKNLSQYLIQRKSELLSKIKAFQIYRIQKAPQKEFTLSTWIPLLLAFFVGLFFFLLIWWGHKDLKYGLLLFGSVYLLASYLFFKHVTIL